MSPLPIPVDTAWNKSRNSSRKIPRQHLKSGDDSLVLHIFPLIH